MSDKGRIIALQRRQSVTHMLLRWRQDAERLEALFGKYDKYDPEINFANEVEIHRNLATAIAYAEMYLGK